MLKGEIQRKTMQLPGQIVEEKKQQQHSEMDAISKSVTISCCFFCARARDIGDQWRCCPCPPCKERKENNNQLKLWFFFFPRLVRGMLNGYNSSANVEYHLRPFHYSLAYLFLVQFQTAIFLLRNERGGLSSISLRLFNNNNNKKKEEIDGR